MMFKWLQNKKHDFPEFWNVYTNRFKKTAIVPIEQARFVAFDTETTGFDKKNDRILSIGAVSIKNNMIQVNKSLELYIEQDVFKKESVKIHGLMRNGSLEKVSEFQAIESFLSYIQNDIIIAHHAGFDYSMINQMLQRHGLGKLQNKVIDTGVLFNKSKHIIYREQEKQYSLDDLCKELNVPKVDRHTASGDALITAIVFLKILSRLNKRNNLEWSYLLNT